MTSIATRRILAVAQKGAREEIKALFLAASDRISGLLQRNSLPDGTINRRNEAAILREAGQIIDRLFVGPDGRSAFADDGVTALAEFPRILNKWYVFVTAAVVRQSKRSMKSVAPEDVFNWLAQAQRPPIREVVLPIGAIGRILAEYDTLHKWVDPKGYILSQRIWRTDLATRQKIDTILADGIRNGTSALQLARQLEQFLVPGRAAVRTGRPYGTDASYDAMRLARTELTAAFGRVTLLAAQLNPYVDTITWQLSGSHPELDICDANAAGSPYPLDGVPVYPAHPHELCVLLQNVSATPQQVTDELRDYLNQGDDAPLTPASDNTLLLTILGSILYSLLQVYFGTQSPASP